MFYDYWCYVIVLILHYSAVQRGRPRKAAIAASSKTKAKVTKKSKKTAKTSVKGKKAKLKKTKLVKKKEKEKKVSKRSLHPNQKLTQRPDIEVVNKDPFFEVK